MLRNVGCTVASLIVLIVLYFALWPVPIEPVAWAAPPNHGYTSPFAPNDRLKGIETLSIGDNHGPEDIAIGADGRIYVSTHEGRIVRLRPDGSHPENWFETGGRPLGIDFDDDGNLIVADAFRGLLSVDPEGTVTELATVADGVPIRYANDVDVAADGGVYFSDASVKFGSPAEAPTRPACSTSWSTGGTAGCFSSTLGQAGRPQFSTASTSPTVLRSAAIRLTYS